MKLERIQNDLQEVPEWTPESFHQAIARNFHFRDFDEAILFVNAIAAISQDNEHFPSIDVRTNQVKVRLTTPEAGGLTDEDFALAKMFDQWIREHFKSR